MEVEHAALNDEWLTSQEPGNDETKTKLRTEDFSHHEGPGELPSFEVKR